MSFFLPFIQKREFPATIVEEDVSKDEKDMRVIVSILSFAVIFSSCKKESATGKLAVYALTAPAFIPNKCQVDPAVAVLAPSPLIDDRDILEYDRNRCEYTLTENAAQIMNAQPGRTAYAMTLNKEVLFYFVNMPPTMSSTCFESVTSSTDKSLNKLIMQLGYPYGNNPAVDDARNHKELISLMSAQGKLK